MQTRFTLAVLVVVLGVAAYSGTVRATPASGVTSTVFAVGHFDAIDAKTLSRGDDPDCTPEVVEAGSGFVDQGGDVHLVRNEGSVDTVVYVASLVPRGAVRRIDEPSPGNCPF